MPPFELSFEFDDNNLATAKFYIEIIAQASSSRTWCPDWIFRLKILYSGDLVTSYC